VPIGQRTFAGAHGVAFPVTSLGEPSRPMMWTCDLKNRRLEALISSRKFRRLARLCAARGPTRDGQHRASRV